MLKTFSRHLLPVIGYVWMAFHASTALAVPPPSCRDDQRPIAEMMAEIADPTSNWKTSDFGCMAFEFSQYKGEEIWQVLIAMLNSEDHDVRRLAVEVANMRGDLKAAPDVSAA